jgi:hypothetical protein
MPQARLEKQMANQQELKFSFHFIEPAENLLEAARKLVDSPDENRRSVAKAVVDVTATGRAIKDALLENRNADLAPYFDFWFADSINCAQKLLHSDDKESRYLAECLIKLEQAAIKSKESLLAEMKTPWDKTIWRVESPCFVPRCVPERFASGGHPQP